MLVDRGTTIMRTVSSHATHLRGHRPRAIVLAVGDEHGIDDATELLVALPELQCPVIVCAPSSAHDGIWDRAGSIEPNLCEHERALDDTSVWIAPSGHLVTVERDRWIVTPHDGADFDAQVGRLCSSLKASYRSRVFMVSSGAELDSNPLVRLLVQRGATLVETRPRADRGLGDHAPVTDIVAHLGASVGTIRKASA